MNLREAFMASKLLGGEGGGGNWDAVAENNGYATIELTSASFIASYAFQSNNTIGEIHGAAVLRVSTRAFQYCSNLAKVSFPLCSSVEGSAFAGCSALTDITMPNLKDVGQQAFNSVPAEELQFPVLESVGMYGFRLASMRSISLPMCHTIGYAAFERCANLSYIYCPRCTDLGYRPFSGTILRSFVASISSMGNGAFYGCTSLSAAYLIGPSLVTIGNDPFANSPMANSSYLGYYGSIYVRESLVAAYRASTEWASYVDRFVGLTDAEIDALLA